MKKKMKRRETREETDPSRHLIKTHRGCET